MSRQRTRCGASRNLEAFDSTSPPSTVFFVIAVMVISVCAAVALVSRCAA